MKSEFLDQILAKLKPEHRAQLVDEINAKIEAEKKLAQDEVVKVKAERTLWFMGGYDAGMSDDPTATKPSGQPWTLEQRRVRSMAAFNMTRNK